MGWTLQFMRPAHGGFVKFHHLPPLAGSRANRVSPEVFQNPRLSPAVFLTAADFPRHGAVGLQILLMEVIRPPVPHGVEDGQQAPAPGREGVFHPWRHHRKYLPMDDPVLLQLPQLLGQHFGGSPGNQPLELTEPLGPPARCHRMRVLYLPPIKSKVASTGQW